EAREDVAESLLPRRVVERQWAKQAAAEVIDDETRVAGERPLGLELELGALQAVLDHAEVDPALAVRLDPIRSPLLGWVQQIDDLAMGRELLFNPVGGEVSQPVVESSSSPIGAPGGVAVVARLGRQ